MKDRDFPRLVLAAGILLLFGYAYIINAKDDLMIGAVIALATTATSYFLGSSKGSSDKSVELARQANNTQQVEVVNPPSNPVNTEQVDVGPRPIGDI